MTFPLTVAHLLWRMQHVHTRARVTTVDEELSPREAGAEGVPTQRTYSSLSFAETAARASALAAGLANVYGAGQGSVVAAMSFNTRAHLELMLGVPTTGAALESINVRTSAECILAQLEQSAPAVLLIDEVAARHPVVGPTVQAVAQATAGRMGQVRFDSTDDPVLHRLRGIGEANPVAACEDEDQVAFLFHTSGTTGPAKTYSVTHRDVVLHALSQAGSGEVLMRSCDVVLPLAPIFHVNGWGLPFRAALAGFDLVLTGSDLSARTILGVLRDRQVTVATGVPTLWYDVCAHASQTAPEIRESLSLRDVVSGGSAIPESVARSVRELLGAEIVCAWGMTETMACSTYERQRPSDRAGKPVPLIEVRVVDTEGQEVASGERGHLEVRGPFIVGSRGQHTMPFDAAATADNRLASGPSPATARLGSAGWLDTGDVGSVDDDGRVTLHDRTKDLIKSGGEWIASAELEQCLAAHPAVAAAAVVARPDPRWSERPVAFVTLSSNAPHPPVDELRDHLSKRFPRWWIPDDIEITDDLPRTAVGKIDKAALRRAVDLAAAAPPSV